MAQSSSSSSTHCFVCTLCRHTFHYLGKVRRHVQQQHKIQDQNGMEKYYLVQHFVVPQPTTTTNGNDDDLEGAGTSTTTTMNAIDSVAANPTKRRKRTKTTCDAQCQASCSECDRLEKREKELKKLLKAFKKEAERARALLEK